MTLRTTEEKVRRKCDSTVFDPDFGEPSRPGSRRVSRTEAQTRREPCSSGRLAHSGLAGLGGRVVEVRAGKVRNYYERYKKDWEDLLAKPEQIAHPTIAN